MTDESAFGEKVQLQESRGTPQDFLPTKEIVVNVLRTGDGTEIAGVAHEIEHRVRIHLMREDLVAGRLPSFTRIIRSANPAANPIVYDQVPLVFSGDIVQEDENSVIAYFEQVTAATEGRWE